MGRGRFKSFDNVKCGLPEWKDTKRGKRCMSECSDGRWKFQKSTKCESGEDEDFERQKREVDNFSALDDIKPMPLIPLSEIARIRPLRRGKR